MYLTLSPPDCPGGWQFAGILVNPFDGHSYLAKIRQGLEGNWLFHLTYTPEPHAGAFIFTFYLALGHLAALLHLSPILIFHLARLVAGLCLLLVAFRFIAWVTPHFQERRLAFRSSLVLRVWVGWVVIFGAFPIDLWVPEAFVPYSLYANPHFPLAMALMLVIFQLILAHSTFNVQHLTFTGLAALALALTLPFALLTVWAVLAVFLAWLYITSRRLPWPQIWLTLDVGVIFGSSYRLRLLDFDHQPDPGRLVGSKYYGGPVRYQFVAWLWLGRPAGSWWRLADYPAKTTRDLVWRMARFLVGSHRGYSALSAFRFTAPVDHWIAHSPMYFGGHWSEARLS